MDRDGTAARAAEDQAAGDARSPGAGVGMSDAPSSWGSAAPIRSVLAWISSDRWPIVWGGDMIAPLQGIIFLPYTTIMYLLSRLLRDKEWCA